MSVQDALWSKVDRGDDDECWEWQGATYNHGYGQVCREDLETTLAHRAVYSVEVEEPGDEYVLHHCDNPLCVNPDHLYLGDQGDNMDDMHERGRENYLSGEEHGRAKLTDDDVRQIVKEYEETNVTQQELADDYGVRQGRISEIVNGERY